MPATLKIEQKRFVTTVAAYYESTEAESVNTQEKAGNSGGGSPGMPQPNPTATAYKTAQTRRTQYGNGTVSQEAMTNLQKPNSQRS